MMRERFNISKIFIFMLTVYSSQNMIAATFIPDYANAIGIQADGKIVIAGTTYGSGVAQILVARLTTALALDSSFGGSGQVTAIIGTQSEANALALQTDQKIVVVGSAISGGVTQIMLTRYNTDGTVDGTFGTGGVTLTSLGSGAQASGVVMQADGSIVITGTTIISGLPVIFVARYTTGGVLDGTYGTAGITLITPGTKNYSNAIVIQTDQRTIIAGSVDNQVYAARLTTAGVVDTQWGPTPIGSDAMAFKLALQADGNFIVVGVTDDLMVGPTENQAFALRYLAAGGLDGGYGTGGIVTISVENFSAAKDVAIQADGKAVLFGFAGLNVALVRLTTTGELDVTYGAGGISIFFVTNFSHGLAGAVLASQKSVITGVVTDGYFVAQLNSDGSLDGTVGRNGIFVQPGVSFPLMGPTAANLIITDTGAATGCTGGALVVNGGVAIGGDLNVCGFITTYKNYRINATGSSNTVLAASEANVSVGFNAALVTGGANNTVVGTSAGASNRTTLRATLVGVQAGSTQSDDADNTFIGYQAGQSNSGASNNTFLGSQAGRTNTTGTSNTFIGYRAGFVSTRGINNTFVGFQAGLNQTTGNRNTFIGTNAGNTQFTDSDSTFVGYQAGLNNAGISQNTFVGSMAGQSNTSGQNTFVGFNAGLLNTLGTRNTFLGNNAGATQAFNNDNTFIGHQAGQNTVSLTTGSQNTFVGSQAGQANVSGQNTLVGYRAGNAITTGTTNTAVGRNSLVGLTTGTNDIAIGDSAGFNYTGAESRNILIGHTGARGENGVIRIGTLNSQTAAFMAGVFNSTIAGGTTVVVNSSGQLGVAGATGAAGSGTVIHLNNSANVSNGDFILYGSQESTERFAQIVAPRSGTLSNLFVRYPIAPAGISSTYTVRVNGVNTALTVTIVSPATSGSNTTASVAVAPFDLISLQAVLNGTPGTNVIASFILS